MFSRLAGIPRKRRTDGSPPRRTQLFPTHHHATIDSPHARRASCWMTHRAGDGRFLSASVNAAVQHCGLLLCSQSTRAPRTSYEVSDCACMLQMAAVRLSTIVGSSTLLAGHSTSALSLSLLVLKRARGCPTDSTLTPSPLLPLDLSALCLSRLSLDPTRTFACCQCGATRRAQRPRVARTTAECCISDA